MMPPTSRAEWLEQYRQGPEILEAFLKTLPAELWPYKPAENRWSVHEIVVHLADTEVQAHVRGRVILAEPGGSILNFDQDKWARELGYTETSVEDALAVIRLMRRVNHALLARLPEEAWQRFAVHSVRGKVTLEDWLQIYTGHIHRHIDQMKRNLEQFQKSA